MERRFLLFLLLSFLALMVNAMWNARNAPPRRLADDAAEQQEAAREQGVGEPDEQDAAAVDDAADQAPNDGPADAEGPAGVLPQEEEAPLEYVTFGSVDQASDARMLATITSAGAGVRRIELANSRYLDLDDRSGYLGHLELAPANGGGLLVQVVGAGTPAALAGIEEGDRIMAAGAEKLVDVDSPDAFQAIIESIEPGEDLSLSVVRGTQRLPTIVATLIRDPLDVIRPESENVLLRRETLPVDFVEPPSLLMTLDHVNNDTVADDADELEGVDLLTANWRIVDQDAASVEFERRVPGYNLVVNKRYELAKQKNEEVGADATDYHLTLTVTIRNAGDRSAAIAYRLDGPNGLPIEGWWYANKIGRNWGSAGLRDVMGRYFDGAPEQQSPAKIVDGDVDSFEGGSMAYMGVDAQYFSAVMLPQKPNPQDVWIDSAQSVLVGPKPSQSYDARYANVTCRLTSATMRLNPGETVEHSYVVFAGPKRPDILQQYHAADSESITLDDLLYYGWFGGIAKLMLGILHFFYGLVGNYGVAIIMLTALVRGCMFPISRGQARSMVRMQELRPEMERIKEKYKGDQQKQAQAMQELYRKHNVNPLAGCLPMLIQMPVFIGLYRGLAVDVELRQASLFGDAVHWCSNLAAPDMFLDWSGVMPDFINRGDGMFSPGPYLNLLPLVTISLWIIQQKMFMPAPANEQAEMQQKIMKYMMIFMGVLFYKVPSGLCLYFIASTLWGIAERKLVPPPTAKTSDDGKASPDRSESRLPARRDGKKTDAKRAIKNGRSGKATHAKSKRRR